MREEHASPEEHMRSISSQTFEAFEQSRINPASTELVYQLAVVNCLLFAIYRDAALDIPWCDDLVVWLSIFWSRLDGWGLVSPDEESAEGIRAEIQCLHRDVC